MRSIVVLGSTGSIGTQALEVARRHPDRFRVVGLAAGHRRLDLLLGQIREFMPPLVAVADQEGATEIARRGRALRGVAIHTDADAVERSAREASASTERTAIV